MSPRYRLRRIVGCAMKADYFVVSLECGHTKTYRSNIPRKRARCQRCPERR